MEKIKILWIDDDINRSALRPFIDEFNDKGFEIIGAENPDEIDKILAKQQDIQCIIIDMLMPHGKKISFEDSHGGLRTGLKILKNLKTNTKLDHIKKIVFTIVDDTNTDIQSYCVNNDIPYFKKHDYYTDTFVEKIKEILSKATE